MMCGCIESQILVGTGGFNNPSALPNIRGDACTGLYYNPPPGREDTFRVT